MELFQQWHEEEVQYIRRKVIEHNMEQLPDAIKTPNENISFILKNSEGKIVGGITGNMFWHHLHIDFLWVDQSLRGRGYGKALLAKMEAFAREKDCRLISLDSFSFQSPEFYKKQGYQVFGTLEDHPKGFCQVFLEKRL
ncbi:ribosomal protein S18 acetylase RimI-like enzyme [Pullulanibacillus pueri]|uniref:N-acetyltransferase n=1 Tax=Pullulanibacillus pueri TaxID=1437324 RepID=A0A8J2ZZX6_9BACL|nr:GNAT family N-acetyltransferase [Pullulanibacillus pueri]MBM7683762.1 ribosomal protein S18 acetylase RimI-like enzyme [Pullulanibacillus pueri]GGH87317.1 N-acetyltransferase [Pullulanibacillus pueri]